MKFKEHDRVRLLVDGENDIYPGGKTLARWDGSPVDAPGIFPAGTIGFVELIVPDDDSAFMVGVFDGDDPELSLRLGSVAVKKDLVEKSEADNEREQRAKGWEPLDRI